MNRKYVALHYFVMTFSGLLFLFGLFLFAYFDRVYGDGVVEIHDAAGRLTGYVDAFTVKWISLIVVSLLSLAMIFISQVSLRNHLNETRQREKDRSGQ